MNDLLKNLFEFLAAAAWPIVVLLGVVWFRDSIAQIATGLGSRAKKVSIGNFAIELDTMPTFTPDWSLDTGDARSLSSSALFDSYSESLFNQIAQEGATDYVIVDIGTGKEWLASRLFIFSIMLERFRGLRCFVFVETRSGFIKRFVGTETPQRVRWSLAQHHPWLEASYVQAYNMFMSTPTHDEQHEMILSIQGELETTTARGITQQFVTNMQNVGNLTVEELEKHSDWVSFESDAGLTWEKTCWLDYGKLHQLLPGLATNEYIVKTASKDKEVLSQEMLRCSGDYVALVNEDRQFIDLVDRRSMLERFNKI